MCVCLVFVILSIEKADCVLCKNPQIWMRWWCPKLTCLSLIRSPKNTIISNVSQVKDQQQQKKLSIFALAHLQPRKIFHKIKENESFIFFFKSSRSFCELIIVCSMHHIRHLFCLFSALFVLWLFVSYKPFLFLLKKSVNLCIYFITLCTWIPRFNRIRIHTYEIFLTLMNKKKRHKCK